MRARSSWASRQRFTLFRKDYVKPGITVDMRPRRYCDPKDMILFLLATCCQDDSKATPVSRDKTLDECFEECFRTVTPVANSDGLKRRLDD